MFLNFCSTAQCVQRWTRSLRPGLTKGRWSHEEDEQLIAFVQSFPNARVVPWSTVIEHIQGRTSKQCRERWFNFLDPSIKRNLEWTKDEDKQLVNLVKLLGKKWSRIAKEMPGRTEHSVKVRFQVLEKSEEVSISGALQSTGTIPNPTKQPFINISNSVSEDNSSDQSQSGAENERYSDHSTVGLRKKRNRQSLTASDSPSVPPLSKPASISNTSSTVLPPFSNLLPMSSTILDIQSLIMTNQLIQQQYLQTLQTVTAQECQTLQSVVSASNPSLSISSNPPLNDPMIMTLLVQQQQESQLLQAQIDQLQYQLTQLQQLQQLQQIQHLYAQSALQHQLLSNSQSSTVPNNITNDH